jgi:hypothetical protein
MHLAVEGESPYGVGLISRLGGFIPSTPIWFCRPSQPTDQRRKGHISSLAREPKPVIPPIHTASLLSTGPTSFT